MDKESLINLIILPLLSTGLVIGIFWIYNYMTVHRCDNQYKKVCIESHTAIMMVPIVYSNDKTTTTLLQPMPREVCDKYETVLKDGCPANAERS